MTGPVAFLGLGAMGQRMARRLLEAGHPVRVWNRDPAKAMALGAAGAQVAGTPGEAAEGASVVLAMVRDDLASRRVWCAPADGALARMPAGAVAVDCSTLGMDWVSELAAAAAAGGVSFLDAPVAGSRPQADSGLLIHLVGGDLPALQRAEPILKAWSTAVHHVGPNGTGALAKLMLNQLFAIQVAALAELIGMARHKEVDLERIVDAIAATPVCSPALKYAAGAMLAGEHAPQFPLELVEKDLNYAAAAARPGGDGFVLAETLRRVVSGAVAAGLGGDNVTALARLHGP